MNSFYAMTWPLDGWLLKLADGWSLPWIVEPLKGNHGAYSVLLVRPDEPA